MELHRPGGGGERGEVSILRRLAAVGGGGVTVAPGVEAGGGACSAVGEGGFPVPARFGAAVRGEVGVGDGAVAVGRRARSVSGARPAVRRRVVAVALGAPAIVGGVPAVRSAGRAVAPGGMALGACRVPVGRGVAPIRSGEEPGLGCGRHSRGPRLVLLGVARRRQQVPVVRRPVPGLARAVALLGEHVPLHPFSVTIATRRVACAAGGVTAPAVVVPHGAFDVAAIARGVAGRPGEAGRNAVTVTVRAPLVPFGCGAVAVGAGDVARIRLGVAAVPGDITVLS